MTKDGSNTATYPVVAVRKMFDGNPDGPLSGLAVIELPADPISLDFVWKSGGTAIDIPAYTGGSSPVLTVAVLDSLGSYDGISDTNPRITSLPATVDFTAPTTNSVLFFGTGVDLTARSSNGDTIDLPSYRMHVDIDSTAHFAA